MRSWTGMAMLAALVMAAPGPSQTAQACNINVDKGKAIPPTPPDLNPKQIKEAKEVIHKLEYEAIWRARRTIASTDLMRLDQQGDTDAAANLQVQTNGQGSISVAAVLVEKSLESAPGEHQKGVRRKTVGALLKSLKEKKIYHVRGRC